MLREKKNAGEPSRAAGGFTLIEVVVSLLIMMIAALGAVSLFSFAVTYNRGANDRARAFAVAQQRMEALRATPYNNLNQALATANTGAVKVGDRYTDERRYDITTTITNELVVSGTPRRKTITVVVRPQDTQARGWGSGAITLVTQRASLEVGPN